MSHPATLQINGVSPKHFHVYKGLSIDDVGAAKGTVVQETRPGAGSKTGGFAEEKSGGATVVRVLWV